MTLTFAQARALNPEALAGSALDYASCAQTLLQAATDTKTNMSGLSTVSWSGHVRDQAERAVKGWLRALAGNEQRAEKAAELITSAVLDFSAASKLLLGAVTLAENAGFVVDKTTGAVTVAAGASKLVTGLAAQAAADAAAAMWSALIKSLVELLSLRDELLAGALKLLLAPTRAGVPRTKEAYEIGSVESLDSPSGPPMAAAQLNSHNRQKLAQDIAALEKKVAEHGPLTSSNPKLLAAKKAYAQLERLRSLQESLNQPDMYLLQYTDETAAVSYGNPDTAQTVATFVPGTTANVHSFPGYTALSQQLTGAAGGPSSSIPGAAGVGPSGSTAMITWLDYGAPQSAANAAFPHAAHKGAPKLREFQNSLAARSNGDQRFVVIGHSYGSTVVGVAASEEGLRADDVLFVGSPGVVHNSASDMVLIDDHGQRLPADAVAERVHATVLPNDAVGWIGADHVGHFGPDPAQDGFGGQTFSSEDPKWSGWRKLSDPIGVHTRGYWESEAFQDYLRDLLLARK
ncbi:alpha/beta hydrolase [Corynebacterium ulceribovis]|uniref:alpha/beta hydrolase n=1 Tax=Corynebacterium ulceribovis TaxID=487732 RepID=UPI00036E0971|nr:alpha/beta hydrolase [Corynebacterium ulceribovis]